MENENVELKKKTNIWPIIIFIVAIAFGVAGFILGAKTSNKDLNNKNTEIKENTSQNNEDENPENIPENVNNELVKKLQELKLYDINISGEKIETETEKVHFLIDNGYVATISSAENAEMQVSGAVRLKDLLPVYKEIFGVDFDYKNYGNHYESGKIGTVALEKIPETDTYKTLTEECSNDMNICAFIYNSTYETFPTKLYPTDENNNVITGSFIGEYKSGTFKLTYHDNIMDSLFFTESN